MLVLLIVVGSVIALAVGGPRYGVDSRTVRDHKDRCLDR